MRYTPVMALRPDPDAATDDHLDDVVVCNPTMFRAEQLADDTWWLCCYFVNGERVTFNVCAERSGRLSFTVGEAPKRWRNLDDKEPS